MARFKTKRQARYDALIHKYRFLPSEAVELSKIKKHQPPGGGERQYPPAMLALQRSRLAAWANYKQWVGREAWLELSDREIWNGWLRRIRRFYGRQHIKQKKDKATGLTVETLTRWVVRKDVRGRKIVAKPSVWEYYDYVFQRLPDEQKWDTPRSHRTRIDQGEVKIDKIRTRRWIEDLKRAIAVTGDPARKEQLQEQIENLESSLRRR